ncbi:RHS repeat-associated core domain-containing protein [Chryseobacterium sp. Marseille-Q3244]|uniref:RHS repeat-associated core domain-containing protein n=1 Tax=Chryseobacterium sp. Marseille-Q3244 TaxID=2758092 RepID=UPI0020246DDC|nr:RHS repeat-associated core domain-containing protein [Chryseobacterium sp. Marseille-Q3244]
MIESAMNDTGYEGGNNIIDYDVNGNMINMKDKGMNTIDYNHLNLPNAFTISNANPIIGQPFNANLMYLYRADGTKLRKTYSTRPPRGSARTSMTDYLDGFQYSYREGGGLCLTCRTESAFEEQAYGNLGKTFPNIGDPPAWKLDFVPTSEGFYSFTENRYIYQYKDHLGNIRVSFAKDSAGVLEITDTNNYYPFGLNHISGMFGTSNFGGLYSYKYQGQELQETGFYSFKWRNYMPDVGRFFNIDPFSENMLINPIITFLKIGLLMQEN